MPAWILVVTPLQHVCCSCVLHPYGQCHNQGVMEHVYSFNSVVTPDIASSVESEDPAEDPCSDDDPDPTGGAPDHWQFTSSTFLEIIHHPHSGIKEPEFIFCDLSSAGLEENFAFQSQHCLGGKPWAPFHT